LYFLVALVSSVGHVLVLYFLVFSVSFVGRVFVLYFLVFSVSSVGHVLVLYFLVFSVSFVGRVFVLRKIIIRQYKKMIDLIYKSESHAIIGAAIEVHRTLGNGFLEPVYQEALALELDMQNIPYEQEKQLRIQYKNQYLKKYYMADFICYDKVLIELKAVKCLIPEHESQVINYLNATGYKLGLLINFGGMKTEIKRFAH